MTRCIHFFTSLEACAWRTEGILEELVLSLHLSWRFQGLVGGEPLYLLSQLTTKDVLFKSFCLLKIYLCNLKTHRVPDIYIQNSFINLEDKELASHLSFII